MARLNAESLWWRQCSVRCISLPSSTHWDLGPRQYLSTDNSALDKSNKNPVWRLNTFSSASVYWTHLLISTSFSFPGNIFPCCPSNLKMKICIFCLCLGCGRKGKGGPVSSFQRCRFNCSLPLDQMERDGFFKLPLKSVKACASRMRERAS